MKRRVASIITIVLVIALVSFLPNCIPGIGIYTLDRPADFTSGIWHGWIAPISLVISIFNSNVTIYEVVNSGWWYDFGFYTAVIGGFGGLVLFRRPKAIVVED